MKVNAAKDAETRHAGGVYTSRQARLQQSELIEEVRRELHPLVTWRKKPLMRWVPNDWYREATHAMEVVAGLDALGVFLQWGDEADVRNVGAALKKLAAPPSVVHAAS